MLKNKKKIKRLAILWCLLNCRPSDDEAIKEMDRIEKQMEKGENMDKWREYIGNHKGHFKSAIDDLIKNF